MAATARWLLVTVSTAGAPAALRVHVWRKLRSLGALYLQQSVCLLPDQPEVARAVRRLLDRVRHDGGEGRVLHLALTDPGEHMAIAEEFRRERSAEYAEVLERTPAFLEELATERARSRTTYAEVEESEADLERFKSWLAKIAARDYFDAPGGAEARDAVERCAAAPWRSSRKRHSPPKRPPNHPPGRWTRRLQAHHRAGKGAGDALDGLHLCDHELAELVDGGSVDLGDHVVGAGHALGAEDALDLRQRLGDLAGHADFGLDQDVRGHLRFRPPFGRTRARSTG